MKEGHSIGIRRATDGFQVTDGKEYPGCSCDGCPPTNVPRRYWCGCRRYDGQRLGGGRFESERLMVKHSNEYKAPEEGVDAKDLYKTVEGL